MADSSNNSGGNDNQPRPPRNMQDLLRFAVEAGEGPSQPASDTGIGPRPLDSERRAFLEAAIKNLTVNVIEILQQSIEVLKGDSENNEEQFIEALENIMHYIDNIDIAIDFHKIGGFQILKCCLDSVHASVRWRTAQLIAELTQNNPYCQDKIISEGYLPILINLLDKDNDVKVATNGLYAISCTIRTHQEGAQAFLEQDGLSVLLRALQRNISKLTIKTVFLLSALINEKPHIKDELSKMGFVEQLVALVANQLQEPDGEEYNQVAEQLLSTLLSLIKHDQDALQQCQRPELDIENILNCVIERGKDRAEYEEETLYAKEILQQLRADNRDASVPDDVDN